MKKDKIASRLQKRKSTMASSFKPTLSSEDAKIHYLLLTETEEEKLREEVGFCYDK